MNDQPATPKDPTGPSRSEPPPNSERDVPVGDMTEEGQTELGPHPSLTHLENLEQADLDALDRDGDGDSGR